MVSSSEQGEKNSNKLASAIIIIGSLIYFLSLFIFPFFSSFIAILLTALITLILSKDNLAKITSWLTILLSSIFLIYSLLSAPHLNITVNSINSAQLSVPFSLENLTEDYTKLVTFNDSYQLFFVEKIYDQHNMGKISIINPNMKDICQNCTWYDIEIQSSGNIQFPLKFNLYSGGDNIYQFPKVPDAIFDCGDGIYSSGQCVLTINSLQNNSAKFIFYSNSSSIQVDPIKTDEQIEYTKSIYHITVRSMAHNAEIRNTCQNQAILCNLGEDLSSIVLPNIKREGAVYSFNKSCMCFHDTGDNVTIYPS